MSSGEVKLESDRSWLSMIVDSLVARPELHAQVLARRLDAVEKAPEVREAIQLIAEQFANTEWRGLGAAQQLEKLESIATSLVKSPSKSARLAARTFDWALGNRRHGRQRHAMSEANLDIDVEELS